MSKVRRYTVSVYVSCPLVDEDGYPCNTGEPTFDERGLVRHLVEVLRRAEPACDLEVMSHEDVEE